MTAPKRIKPFDLMAGLRYIADSPPHQYGGFHPGAVETAKAAIERIERLEDALAYGLAGHDVEPETLLESWKIHARAALSAVSSEGKG